MRKNIAIPRELVEKISEVAEDDGWSFSKEICYLAFVGLKHFEKLFENNPNLYNKYKTDFNFDVDSPKRRVIHSDY